MRISAAFIVIFCSIESPALCGLFRVEAYVPNKTKNEIILNPQSISRTRVKLSNGEKLNSFKGRVIKAELWLEKKCSTLCEGRLESVSGAVPAFQETLLVFNWTKENLIKEVSCK